MVKKLMVNILASVTLAGSVLADGNIVPATDNVGDIGRSDKMWNDVYCSNVVAAGKAMVVSTNSTYKLMVVDGTFTNGQVQVSWPTAFGAAPRGVVLTWADDMTGKALGGSNAIGAVSMTVTSFVPKVALPINIATNIYYLIVGQAP